MPVPGRSQEDSVWGAGKGSLAARAWENPKASFRREDGRPPTFRQSLLMAIDLRSEPIRILSLANSSCEIEILSFPSRAAFTAAMFTRFAKSAPPGAPQQDQTWLCCSLPTLTQPHTSSHEPHPLL